MRLGLIDGQWEKALTEARLALIDKPWSPKVHLTMGICYFHRRDFGEAIDWFGRAEDSIQRALRQSEEGQIKLSLAPIFLFRGISYAAKKLPNAARADLQKLKVEGSAPIRWESFAKILLPDELSRARIVAEKAGLV